MINRVSRNPNVPLWDRFRMSMIKDGMRRVMNFEIEGGGMS
jgi:hypothetical protein